MDRFLTSLPMKDLFNILHFNNPHLYNDNFLEDFSLVRENGASQKGKATPFSILFTPLPLVSPLAKGRSISLKNCKSLTLYCYYFNMPKKYEVSIRNDKLLSVRLRERWSNKIPASQFFVLRTYRNSITFCSVKFVIQL